jgi:hypothetical protein
MTGRQGSIEVKDLLQNNYNALRACEKIPVRSGEEAPGRVGQGAGVPKLKRITSST